MSAFKDGAQHEFFVGGAQQLCTKLAESLASEVALGHEVDSVSQVNSGVVIRAGERSWTSRRAIFAVAPPKLTDIAFTPALPPAITQYARESKLGAYSKFVAIFDTPWWQDQGLSGIAHVTDGPLRMIVDGAAESGRGILIGFSVANEAAQLSTLPRGRATFRSTAGARFGVRARRPDTHRPHRLSLEPGSFRPGRTRSVPTTRRCGLSHASSAPQPAPVLGGNRCRSSVQRLSRRSHRIRNARSRGSAGHSP